MTPHPDDPHDPLLSRLYRELPDLAPSADTDAALKAAARRAVGAGPGRRPAFLAAHWRSIGATAAALLLGVGLTVQWRAHPQKLETAIAVAPPATDVPAAPAQGAMTERADARVAAAGDAAGPVTAPARRPAPPPALAGEDVPADLVASTEAPALLAAPAAPAAQADNATASPPPAPERAKALARAPAAAEAKVTQEAEAPVEAAEAAAATARNATAADRSVRLASGADREAREAIAAAAPPPVAGTRPEASPVAPAATTVDYRLALSSGRFSEALAALAAPASPAEAIDRQLLLWQLKRQAPACGHDLGREALLCEGLRQRAAGTGPSLAWRRELDASGLVSGEFAYRRALVAALFGPAPSP